MKKRNGFVSNSSSSSFIVALPKNYELSEEELEAIKEKMEDYDCYFSYYEEMAEEAGEIELMDERERIQKMIETGVAEPEVTEPVTDEVKSQDIRKGLKWLTINGYIWKDSNEWQGQEIPIFTAGMSIVNILMPKIKLAEIDQYSSDTGQIINVLADVRYEEGLERIKEHFQNEN